jgi:hypothetical protein
LSGTNGEQPRYRVEALAAATEQLKRLYHKAQALGIEQRFVTSLKTILRRLAEDAEEFGEPSYELAAAGQQVRMGGNGPLFVTYAVHPPSRSVFIRVFRLMG